MIVAAIINSSNSKKKDSRLSVYCSQPIFGFLAHHLLIRLKLSEGEVDNKKSKEQQDRRQSHKNCCHKSSKTAQAQSRINQLELELQNRKSPPKFEEKDK